jgi:hypothetical protein
MTEQRARGRKSKQEGEEWGMRAMEMRTRLRE